MNDLEKLKEEYKHSGQSIADFIQTYKELTIDDKRKLISWSGENVYVGALMYHK